MVRPLLPLLFAALALAQQAKIVYPIPSPSDFSVSKDVVYGKWSGGKLLMDVYRPARIGATARLPVIVFLNTFGVPRREDEMYTGWAKIAAAHGFAAINPDSHSGGIEQDFNLLLAYLAKHAADLRIDANQVAVSGKAWVACFRRSKSYNRIRMCASTLSIPTSEVRTVCVSSASTGLCGGRRVIAVPTATRIEIRLDARLEC